jgi:BirA family biotin operon repressor/biotin-[acetyl-CoA-carboxylase] ligase
MTALTGHWQDTYHLLLFDELDSTHLEARRLTKMPMQENFIVWAKTQQAGKGRNTRQWDSPAGNLYMSLLRRIDVPAATAPQLSFVMALATMRAIAPYIREDYRLTLKWPNDLLVDSKKIGGILLETRPPLAQENIEWCILSVGLNVACHPQLEGGYEATHLADVGNEAVAVDALMTYIVQQFEQLLTLWKERGFHAIRKLWLTHAYNLDKAITVHQGNERISGIFRGLSSEGALLLELAGGQLLNITSGEVWGQI